MMGSHLLKNLQCVACVDGVRIYDKVWSRLKATLYVTSFKGPENGIVPKPCLHLHAQWCLYITLRI